MKRQDEPQYPFNDVGLDAAGIERVMRQHSGITLMEHARIEFTKAWIQALSRLPKEWDTIEELKNLANTMGHQQTETLFETDSSLPRGLLRSLYQTVLQKRPVHGGSYSAGELSLLCDIERYLNLVR